MNVAQLIEELEKLPQEATVNIWLNRPDDIARDPVKFNSHVWNGEVFADITCE